MNARCSLLVLFAAAVSVLHGAETSNPHPFLPAGATVVLLAGLPGDLESERAYHDQLQGWLELLENPAVAPERLFVLSDPPETAMQPINGPSRFLNATRQDFVALGQSLSGRTNPLVVIVWGHGGAQAAKPVFHVRGPRITAEDFKTFAAQAARSESNWILFFRGSGKMANELAEERRQIISSENETSFTSDPIGLPLVIQALRSNPALNGQALGEELARATVAWYHDRSLARTEEPTLWIGREKLRMLAGENADSTAASPRPLVESSNDLRPSATTNPALSKLLPPAWAKIARVDSQKYLDAPGIVLWRRTTYTLASNPAIAIEDERFLQVLTPEGKHLGDFDFSYSSTFETITILDCEVLQPNGRLIRLDPEEIREGPEESVGDYQKSRRKFFSLPGVVPGAVLRVHTLAEWKNYPLPHISLEIPLKGELPIREWLLQISVPKDSPFHFSLDQITGDPGIKQTSYGSSYSWHFEDLPAREREALAPPRDQPALHVSTFADWTDFADWYGRLVKLTDVITPEIAAKAADVSGGAKTQREKAIALYNYVTGLRYVAIPLGVNSFRPHAAAKVLKNQFGDCKDKANLFNSLLRSQDIEAHLVLVPRFSQAQESVPGFAFNHAISRVTVDGEVLWADTTDDICRFGLLPPGDAGRQVLVIDGKSAALTRLPLPEPGDHRFKLRARIDCRDPEEAPAGRLSVSTAGFSDYQLRFAARALRESDSSAPLLGGHFQPVAGAFALENQHFTAISALGENFEWQGEGKCVGICSRAENKWTLRAPFWLPKEWSVALHHRNSPLFLNQGYPIILEEEIELALPKSAQQIRLPSPRHNPTQPLRWKIDWVTATEGKLTGRLEVELAQGELSRSETPVFQEQLRSLMSALAGNIGFSAP